MRNKFVILASQCKAARAMLGWSRRDLAKAARVAERTVVDFERGARTPHERTLIDIKRALEAAGIEFIDKNGGGVGVRFREPFGS